MKSWRIIFVLANVMLSRVDAKFMTENKVCVVLHHLSNYIYFCLKRIYSWFSFILFYLLRRKKEFSNIRNFSHVSLFCSNSLRYRLTRQTRDSRLVDSRVRLSRGCDSFCKTLHWILDAFPTVVNAKESGFLAIASRDSPHFRFNGVDTRNPEALFCERPQILHARVVYRFNCTQLRAKYETYLSDAPEYPPRWLA